MRFEARQPMRYAAPVAASELHKDTVYFSLSFLDEAMRIPILEPLVFIGRDLEPADVGRVYFQDYSSYQQGVRYGFDATAGTAEFLVGSETEIGHIFEYERALDELPRCALCRRKVQDRGC